MSQTVCSIILFFTYVWTSQFVALSAIPTLTLFLARDGNGYHLPDLNPVQPMKIGSEYFILDPFNLWGVNMCLLSWTWRYLGLGSDPCGSNLRIRPEIHLYYTQCILYTFTSAHIHILYRYIFMYVLCISLQYLCSNILYY